MNEPVEALIKEARQRARRRRLVIGAVAAAAVAVAAIGVTASLDGGLPQSQGAAVDSPAWPTSFGIFEPARGRIVYTDGPGMSAIDPTDPSSVDALTLPNGMGVLTPAGWSADGTRLALTSEHSGSSYVLDADGAITPVPNGGGCCWFVTDPWLSPDGTAVVDQVTADRLRLRDIGSGRTSRVIELHPRVADLDSTVGPTATWSPDGSRIAFTLYREVGEDRLPTIYVVNLDTGAVRQSRTGFGHIRQTSWAPDSSHLLVIAGPWRMSTELPGLNPLVNPKKTGLFLLDTDATSWAGPASRPLEIASGHYVAATWSPDGEQIAAIDFAPSVRRLVVMSADGSASRVLADLPANDLFTGLAWHPAPAPD
ncbi:TolB family protein [Agromyces bauzanensis]